MLFIETMYLAVKTTAHVAVQSCSSTATELVTTAKPIYHVFNHINLKTVAHAVPCQTHS